MIGCTCESNESCAKCYSEDLVYPLEEVKIKTVKSVIQEIFYEGGIYAESNDGRSFEQVEVRSQGSKQVDRVLGYQAEGIVSEVDKNGCGYVKVACIASDGNIVGKELTFFGRGITSNAICEVMNVEIVLMKDIDIDSVLIDDGTIKL